MRLVRFIPAAFCVLFGGGAIAACGSDEPRQRGSDEEEETPSKSVWEQLQACGLAGQFRVTTAPMSSCDDWPRAEEMVSVDGAGNSATLRAGLLELQITAGGAGCSFTAKGCASTPPSSEGGSDARYFAPEMTLSKGGAGAKLVAKGLDVVGSYAGPCAEAAFEMTPATKKGCDPIGEYEASAEASILTGTCDITWGPGKVTVSSGTEGYSVDWAGTVINELALDPTTCTLTGSKGVAPDFWSYNSANRSAEIELRFTEGSVKGTVKDKLDGVTFDGKTCAGATFDLVASVPPPRETHPLEPTCSEPPPPLCGNGVCEEGEGCTWCDDCKCGDGQACAPDSVCRTPCTLPTESTACAAGERCSAVGSDYKMAIFPDEDLYCEAAGPKKIDEQCAKTSECGAGLLCHMAWDKTKGYCRPPCGDGLPACKSPDVCGEQGDGSGQGAYPTAIMGCEHYAGPGEDCTMVDCQNGLGCVKSCTNNVCDTYCTKPCSSSSDCPSEIPVCKLGYCE